MMKKYLAPLLLTLLVFCFGHNAAAEPANRELTLDEKTEVLFGTDSPDFYLYVNARFGFSVLVPAIFDTASVIPDNGDGIILTDKTETYRFTASGSNVIDEEINGLKSLYESSTEYLGDTLKESSFSDNSFSLLSLDEGQYTFQMTSADGSTLYSLEIVYPENAPDSFKAQVSKSAESLKKSDS